MSDTPADEPRAGGGNAPDRRSRAGGLPRRDVILLPVIVLLTLLTIGFGAEGLARTYCPESKADACLIADQSGGRFRPNCTARMKLAEGAWVRSDYNECGYRSAHPCRTMPAGALRVVVLGTSAARGYWVSYEQSFAGRVENDLTAACGRTVDLQNLAQFGANIATEDGVVPVWHHVADRVTEALALRPAALVLVMMPFDIEDYAAMPPELAPSATAGTASADHRAPNPTLLDNLADVARVLLNKSRFILLARSVALRDTDRYVVNYLKRGDMTGYLHTPFSPAWALRLRVADATIGRIASRARDAGIPLIVALMPQRAQAALSPDRVDKHDTDPFAIGLALADIARAHGADFVDITSAMRRLDDPASLFFEIDGHPNPSGHALLAREIEARLVDDVAPFSGCHLGSLAAGG